MTGVVVRSDPEGRPVPWMGLDVFLPVPDAETFAAAARDWLSELPVLLAPDEWEEVLRNEKPRFTGKPKPLWPGYDGWAEPFTVWAEIVVAPVLPGGLPEKPMGWPDDVPWLLVTEDADWRREAGRP